MQTEDIQIAQHTVQIAQFPYFMECIYTCVHFPFLLRVYISHAHTHTIYGADHQMGTDSMLLTSLNSTQVPTLNKQCVRTCHSWCPPPAARELCTTALRHSLCRPLPGELRMQVCMRTHVRGAGGRERGVNKSDPHTVITTHIHVLIHMYMYMHAVCYK